MALEPAQQLQLHDVGSWTFIGRRFSGVFRGEAVRSDEVQGTQFSAVSSFLHVYC